MRIFDNGGQTFDRYVVFPWGNDEALFLSHNCDSPQGVSAYSDGHCAGECYGKEITLADLPDNVRAHIKARVADLTDGFSV